MTARPPHRSSGGLSGVRASVITVSDSAAAGAAPDTTGPVLVDWLRGLGLLVAGPVIVGDEVAAIRIAIRGAVDAGARIVVTTGGTGLSSRDVTPEATAEVLERTIPGIPEALRARARERVPTTDLSRGLAGVIGHAIVVNLPGSPGGVKDGMAVLGGLLPHAVEQLGTPGSGPVRADPGNPLGNVGGLEQG